MLRVDTDPIDRPPPHRMPRFISTGPLLIVLVAWYATPWLLPCQLQLSWPLLYNLLLFIVSSTRDPVIALSPRNACIAPAAFPRPSWNKSDAQLPPWHKSSRRVFPVRPSSNCSMRSCRPLPAWCSSDSSHSSTRPSSKPH